MPATTTSADRRAHAMEVLQRRLAAQVAAHDSEPSLTRRIAISRARLRRSARLMAIIAATLP